MSPTSENDDMGPGGDAGRHDRRRFCGARKRQGEGTCTRPAGWGTDHVGFGTCKLHGGTTPGGRKAAAKQEAVEKVALFGARRDVHPAEALLELVQWTAGEVDFWREQVRVIAAGETVVGVADDPDDPDGEPDVEAGLSNLTWGKTKHKTGGDDVGTTFEAKPNIAYVMLTDASNRLASYAAAALRAGVEERRVQLAENAGALVAGVMQRALRGIFDELVRALVEHPDAAAIMQAVWPRLVGEIVPRELRALAPPA